jgi:hypothetical protein
MRYVHAALIVALAFAAGCSSADWRGRPSARMDPVYLEIWERDGFDYTVRGADPDVLRAHVDATPWRLRYVAAPHEGTYSEAELLRRGGGTCRDWAAYHYLRLLRAGQNVRFCMGTLQRRDGPQEHAWVLLVGEERVWILDVRDLFDVRWPEARDYTPRYSFQGTSAWRHGDAPEPVDRAAPWLPEDAEEGPRGP